jgi:putative addiction module component (TIGR02574 family)
MFSARLVPVMLARQGSRGDTTVPTIEAPGIDRLTVRERLELIEQIWDSLPEQVNPDEIPAWHLAELANSRSETSPSSPLALTPRSR